LIFLSTGTKGTALAAGSCTNGDGNNLGICIAATAQTGLNAWSYTSGVVAALGAVQSNCFAYSAAGSLCGQCATGYAPTSATTATSITACASTNVIAGCTVYNAVSGAIPTCGACGAGWVPSTGLTACQGCSALTVSCGPTWPTSAGGYYWNTTAFVSCAANAAACTSGAATTVTTACNSGYYLNAAGVCVSGTFTDANCW